MRILALLMLPAMSFAAPVPKDTEKPNVELKLFADNPLVLEVTIQNNRTESLELPYRRTPLEHFVIELQSENGKQYKIEQNSKNSEAEKPGILSIPAGGSKTISIHTCHSLPNLGGPSLSVTFTATMLLNGRSIKSESLTVPWK